MLFYILRFKTHFLLQNIVYNTCISWELSQGFPLNFHLCLILNKVIPISRISGTVLTFEYQTSRLDTIEHREKKH